MTNEAAVVEQYFARMRARDTSVADLFHEDAELIGLGKVIVGRAAIGDFYGRAISDAAPSPRTAGPLLVGEGRVAAEILIDLATGDTMHVVDVFVVEEGLIRSLTYFVSDHP